MRLPFTCIVRSEEREELGSYCIQCCVDICINHNITSVESFRVHRSHSKYCVTKVSSRKSPSIQFESVRKFAECKHDVKDNDVMCICISKRNCMP